MAMAAKQGAGAKKEMVRSSSAQERYDKMEGKEDRPISEQAVRPKNEKRKSFGVGGGGSKLKSSVEA